MADTDYRSLYDEKCAQLNELDSHFQTFQDETNSIIVELQNELKESKKKQDLLTKELNQVKVRKTLTKEKRKTTMNVLEKELEQIKKEKNDFQTRFYDFQKKVVDLQNINEALESENRASKMMLSEYEHRVQKTMEELAMLQTELEENKTTSAEQIARLCNQLKETQEQLYVVHLKHQKHNDESEHRRSRMSSISGSIRGAETPRSSVKEPVVQLPMASTITNQENQQSSINVPNDFKRKPPGNFYKTLDMMSSLIGDLDSKMVKLRNQRKTLVIS